MTHLNTEKLNELALAYVEHLEHFTNSRFSNESSHLINQESLATDWAFDKVLDITFDEPEALLDIVLAVLELEPSHLVLEVLAAGPLEDYLSIGGEKVIERVEERARNDPRFASLLGGVWKNEMSDDVWRRVQNVWDRRGWDGTPSE